MSDMDLAFSPQPHNGYFKEVFSQPQYAQEFFLQYLPPEISARVNWETLKVQSSTFVEASLQEVRSDLLFTVSMGDTPVNLYLLFEHQSSVDPLVPLRLLAYMMEVWRAHGDGLPLPPIIPFVLHQGPDRWTVSQNFLDVFRLPEDLRGLLKPFLPEFHYGLLDLSQTTPETEEMRDSLKLILNLMKWVRTLGSEHFLEWIAAWLIKPESIADDLLKLSLIYTFATDGSLDVDQISHILELNEPIREKAMTVLEKVNARGEARGEARGLRVGTIQTLQRVLGDEVSEMAALERCSLEALDLMVQNLQARLGR